MKDLEVKEVELTSEFLKEKLKVSKRTHYIFEGQIAFTKEKFSYKEAVEAYKTLKNCTECEDCVECVDCVKCSVCINCTDCKECQYLKGASDCVLNRHKSWYSWLNNR